MASADIEDIRRALGSPKTPKTIKQEALSLDPAHHHRLCNLAGNRPNPDDLNDYGDDLLYCDQIQPELFRYLLPICLWAWKNDLEHYVRSDYGVFGMNFSLVLIRDKWRGLLDAREFDAVRRFVGQSILENIDRQTDLRIDDPNHSARVWIDSIGTYAIAFDDLSWVWNGWWRMETAGQAVAVLQYVSCLIYGSHENPIFVPWTPERGGGPPSLWNCTALLCEDGWHPENVTFLRTTLSPEYIGRSIQRARAALGRHVHWHLPVQMAADLEERLDLLSARLACLPEMVANPEAKAADWPSAR